MQTLLTIINILTLSGNMMLGAWMVWALLENHRAVWAFIRKHYVLFLAGIITALNILRLLLTF